ncbi:MAG: hypothetical protein SGILL_006482, partial [Bacillariaceae sp.]
SNSDYGGGFRNKVGNILHRHGRSKERREKEEMPQPLAAFKTLQYPLKHAKLVGLYFAASWCPQSTPVTETLDEYFRELILRPPSPEDEDGGDSTTDKTPDEKVPLSIVHVSSDKKEAAFADYVRDNWIAVPYGSHEQLALKRHFLTCAKFEVETLGIDRQYEIPTLLIIDSETQTVLTANGADDLDEYDSAEDVLNHWIDLHNLLRGLEDKYNTDVEEGEEEYEEDEDDGVIADRQKERRQKAKTKKGSNANSAEAVSSLFGPN